LKFVSLEKFRFENFSEQKTENKKQRKKEKLIVPFAFAGPCQGGLWNRRFTREESSLPLKAGNRSSRFFRCSVRCSLVAAVIFLFFQFFFFYFYFLFSFYGFSVYPFNDFWKNLDLKIVLICKTSNFNKCSG
jgi:hypothetical protein